MQRIMSRARLLHERLDRVVVFDIRFRWWGLGNNLSRWLALLRLGLASGRATFLWMSDRAWPTPLPAVSAASTRRQRPMSLPTPFFDMGAHFESTAGEWDWSPATDARVRTRMASLNVSAPVTITHRCLAHGINCERHELRWPPDSHVLGTEAEVCSDDSRNPPRTGMDGQCFAPR